LLDVAPFEKLINVIMDEVVFEYAHHVRLFVVDEIVDDFDITVVTLHVFVLMSKPCHYAVVQEGAVSLCTDVRVTVMATERAGLS
jgi:hypothetical protein